MSFSYSSKGRNQTWEFHRNTVLAPHPQTQVSKFIRNAVTSQFLVPAAYSKHCNCTTSVAHLKTNWLYNWNSYVMCGQFERIFILFYSTPHPLWCWTVDFVYAILSAPANRQHSAALSVISIAFGTSRARQCLCHRISSHLTIPMYST